MLKRFLISLVLAATLACKIVVTLPHPPDKPPVDPPPPQVPVRTVAALVTTSGTAQPVVGAACHLKQQRVPYSVDASTNHDGYVAFNGVYADLRDTVITCYLIGYNDFYQQITLHTSENENIPGFLVMTPDMPPPPDRMTLMTAQLTFQGLTLSCPETGKVGIFDVMLDTLSPSCRQEFYKVKRAAGDKVIALAISHSYSEPGVPAAIAAGKDWTNDLTSFYSFLTEVVQQGFYVQLHLAMDGEGAGPGYNDPVGSTYGFDWGMANLPRILDRLKPLAQYIRFYPGFDGVFYGWEPSGVKVPAYAALVRSIIPNAVIGIEFNTGHIPIGEGGGDFLPGSRMKDYDIVAGEFNPGLNDDATWQILGRMVRPYNRPADQPSGDDPNPPFYLIDSERGPRVFNCFEWNLYDWVRDRVSVDQLAKDRARLIAMGCKVVG